MIRTTPTVLVVVIDGTLLMSPNLMVLAGKVISLQNDFPFYMHQRLTYDQYIVVLQQHDSFIKYLKCKKFLILKLVCYQQYNVYAKSMHDILVVRTSLCQRPPLRSVPNSFLYTLITSMMLHHLNKRMSWFRKRALCLPLQTKETVMRSNLIEE